MLPNGFPKWRTVHEYYSQWGKRSKEKEPSLLELVLKKLVRQVRTQHGRKEQSSFFIFDAQSVKNTDTAKEKGYDAGKKYQVINIVFTVQRSQNIKTKLFLLFSLF